jgi:hypothetical protein
MMALMKFRKSISQTEVLRTKQFIAFLLLMLVVLTGCTKNDYPRPTKDYYVNDFAQILHPVTRDFILYEADNMYGYTEDFEGNGGTQIVFATFVVENEDDVFAYDLNALFNQWRIGKNDMGVLVAMFFTESVVDEITYLNLEQAYIVPGLQMESVLTPPVQEDLLNATLFGTVSDDLDVSVMYLLYELKELIYDQAYDLLYEWDETDMEYFIQERNNYVYSSDDSALTSMSWLIFLFSPYSSFWDKAFTALPFVLMFLVSGGLIVRKGGGGRTGGFWIFRKR